MPMNLGNSSLWAVGRKSPLDRPSLQHYDGRDGGYSQALDRVGSAQLS
jgi:hypothetical protein